MVSAADITATVETIEDGDTLVVNYNDQSLRLQLLGIDAPEDAENPKLQRDLKRTGLAAETLMAIGKAASAHMATLTAVGESVTLQGDINHKDRYGRVVVGILNAKGRSLSMAMVEDGYAVFNRFTEIDEAVKAQLLEKQAAAISEKKGIWGSHADTAETWRGQPK